MNVYYKMQNDDPLFKRGIWCLLFLCLSKYFSNHPVGVYHRLVSTYDTHTINDVAMPNKTTVPRSNAL